MRFLPDGSKRPQQIKPVRDLGTVAPGGAGLAGGLRAGADPAARETLGLQPDSRVLAFSAEGATDPELYARLVGT